MGIVGFSVFIYISNYIVRNLFYSSVTEFVTLKSTPHPNTYKNGTN